MSEIVIPILIRLPEIILLCLSNFSSYIFQPSLMEKMRSKRHGNFIFDTIIKEDYFRRLDFGFTIPSF